VTGCPALARDVTDLLQEGGQLIFNKDYETCIVMMCIDTSSWIISTAILNKKQELSIRFNAIYNRTEAARSVDYILPSGVAKVICQSQTKEDF